MKRELKALLKRSPNGTCQVLAELADAIDELNAAEWDDSAVQSEIAAALRLVVAEHIDAEEDSF